MLDILIRYCTISIEERVSVVYAIILNHAFIILSQSEMIKKHSHSIEALFIVHFNLL